MIVKIISVQSLVGGPGAHSYEAGAGFSKQVNVYALLPYRIRKMKLKSTRNWLSLLGKINTLWFLKIVYKIWEVSSSSSTWKGQKHLKWSLLKSSNWTLLGHDHSSIGMYDKMECSCAMAASSLRNSVKRTVAKTSVRSREMALGFGGGEFFNNLPASPWVELLLLLSENIRI